MDIGVRLTTEQQAIVDADVGDRVRLAGASGTGKTTTLVARYLRLVAHHRASSVLVLCPTRAGADRFRDAVVPHLAGGFDALPITTVWGLAFDLLSRRGTVPTLLTAADQREEVARLLAADGPGRWPSAPDLVGRRAFAAEVAGAVHDLQSSFLDDAEVLARADAAGQRARWADLVAFAARYRSALGAQGLVDGAGLLMAAVAALAGSVPERSAGSVPERSAGSVPANDSHRFVHVLVDDAHRSVRATGQLVTRLTGGGAGYTVAGDPSGRADHPWAGLAPDGPAPPSLSTVFVAPRERVLVTCGHPSVEAEAAVGELLAAHHDGVAWSDMAVVARSARGPRARSIARALGRHGVPAAGVPAGAGDEPVVRAVIDVLHWVAGDSTALDRVVASPVGGLDPFEVRAVRRQAALQGIPLEAHPRLAALARLRADLVARTAGATPADLAFEVWRQRLGHLVGTDDRSLDALFAMIEGLRRRANRRPHERLVDFLDRHREQGQPGDAWESIPGRGESAGEVAVVSIAGAAGRHWHTVVVAGCVEGELPHVRARTRHFDRLVLTDAGSGGGGSGGDAADRRSRVLADERRLFSLASSRAAHRLIATAAPEPGVLLSRFVEGWDLVPMRLPVAPGPVPIGHTITQNATPVFPDGHLRLSASQLSTYDDCPLRYAYEYGLGVRGEAGVHAELGSLVHKVLADFNDPVPGPDSGEVVPHTREGLQALAERLWRDDIARYRPQVEEARRDYFAMLDAWWEAEGGDDRLAPEVLAVERRFEVDAGGHTLTGFIDRIDRADGGEGIRIVDYKTGRTEPRLDAVADDIQLAIYHLAASRDPNLAALGPATQLRLLYVRAMHAFDQPVTDDHAATTEARVAATASRIVAEDFEPSVDANCRICSFHRLCPLQDEGRVTVSELSVGS